MLDMTKLFSNIIHQWFQKNQHVFFKYSKGFYHLNYVANSPKLMMESFKKMLFCKYDKNTDIIYTNNPFNKGFLQFSFLEEGLVLLNTEIVYKKNVCYHQVINAEVENDYYTLSYNVFSHPTSEQSIQVGSFGFSNEKWILSKPRFLSTVSYQKKSSSDSIIIYFNKKWLDTYIKKDKTYENASIKTFFDSDDTITILPDNTIELSDIAKEIKELFTETGVEDPLQLKFKTYKLVATFIRQYQSNNIIEDYTNLPQKDIDKIKQIAFYLEEHSNQKFMGIDQLCSLFEISPTKLKNDFKHVFAMGVFGYFRSKQMYKAKDLLQTGNYRVKEIAQLCGYENVSKFSKAFQQVNKILPSKIIFTKNK